MQLHCSYSFTRIYKFYNWDKVLFVIKDYIVFRGLLIIGVKY